jgi:hypothetical protein
MAIMVDQGIRRLLCHDDRIGVNGSLYSNETIPGTI